MTGQDLFQLLCNYDYQAAQEFDQQDLDRIAEKINLLVSDENFDKQKEIVVEDKIEDAPAITWTDAMGRNFTLQPNGDLHFTLTPNGEEIVSKGGIV